LGSSSKTARPRHRSLSALHLCAITSTCYWILAHWNALDDDLITAGSLPNSTPKRPYNLDGSYDRLYLLDSHDFPFTSTAAVPQHRRYALPQKHLCDVPTCLPHLPAAPLVRVQSTRVARLPHRRNGRRCRRQIHRSYNRNRQNQPPRSLLHPVRLEHSLQRSTTSSKSTWPDLPSSQSPLATKTDCCSKTSTTMKLQRTCIPWR
jgi:hypothetical protein